MELECHFKLVQNQIKVVSSVAFDLSAASLTVKPHWGNSTIDPPI
jgi:hypothetical protein